MQKGAVGFYFRDCPIFGPKFGEYVFVEEFPEPIRKVVPVYPKAARRTGLEGRVVVHALVGVDGRVQDTKVVKSDPDFNQAALYAVRQYEFKPALTNGKPVAVWVAIPIRFVMR